MAFNENSRVKIPAILQLMSLGYEYVPSSKQIRNEENNIFSSIFILEISRINEISEEEAQRILDEINLELDYDDLGKKFYERLTATSGIKLIDFDSFSNNSFHVTTELTCKSGDEEFRPDITKLGETIKEGKNQRTVLTTAEEDKIISTFNEKQAVEDLSVVVSKEEIAAKNYSFSAGQYFEVKIEYVDITPAEFAEKMSGFENRLAELFQQGNSLDMEIQSQLKLVSYE
ncbi:hypothetical protein OA84_09195 [Kaistella solincola]|uniref:type I site-specific deoxyribonuclease n=1 Tax=Kaistella solincola TaxID=510955 RepID=A0ABR4ZRK9_9FLAO|nr:type I restriction endonuclease [Kaistella solincola]KIA83648.1 hypothetical protein OA84_09195 [Kaistella solincola]